MESLIGVQFLRLSKWRENPVIGIATGGMEDEGQVSNWQDIKLLGWWSSPVMDPMATFT